MHKYTLTATAPNALGDLQSVDVLIIGSAAGAIKGVLFILLSIKNEYSDILKYHMEKKTMRK